MNVVRRPVTSLTSEMQTDWHRQLSRTALTAVGVAGVSSCLVGVLGWLGCRCENRA
ncbi:hypothetical protein-transmembrane prediction [Rhodopirellula baltica SH 1]|uniref:Uncharacterized protein n=1 Tax=Rhodopirellula baltica (strain DSM 10527 / NCIMB 13988 / SH1) TaxID=243090 RepID=Q7UTF0_RHOBA|nr:hypothetical protein-transmembrane prediction [Rhodopirellula baltica SH 1]